MKNTPVIFALFGCDDLANSIHQKLKFKTGEIKQHQFPDEEVVIKINSNIEKSIVIFIANLDRPNTKLLPLIFAAETARELGASKIILIAPYLAYMRQDKPFESGQGITSKYFAKLISSYFDELVTVDPHLHRWHDLSDIYTIPTRVLHATNSIALWILENIQHPVLIGPDIESTQWVESIAKKSSIPYLISEKIRLSDQLVEISIPDIKLYQKHTPVLIDDIISTGVTMIKTIKHLQSLNMKPPVCIGIHAVFAKNAYQNLLASGAERVISCNTIQHISNHIDISNEIVNINWD